MRRWSWKRTTPVIKRWALALGRVRERLTRPPFVRPPSGRAGRTPAVVPGAVLAALLLLAGLWALRVPAPQEPPQAVMPAQQEADSVHAAAQPLPTVQALPAQAPAADRPHQLDDPPRDRLTPVHREAAASPLPEPGADPFRAYARIAGVGSSGSPGAVRADDPLRDGGSAAVHREVPVAPAPRLELPALPVPPSPVAQPQPRPQPETLQRYLVRAGWRLEAVSLGQEASVLLSKDGGSGLWRAGEELEAGVRLVRVEPGRVELARGKERAYLEVSP
ncbi:hypothetical protein [Calidithermus roseus]|uniref:Type II secretion system protein B n=1 Tax=Calidithermus roseus TaxID=1644118 RepID=A0A399EB45_9DEIN|nr:hypothetical protein [Calidithermus roseus]RIH81944.1 hypothetical protein Mrose_03500 [Calidithermus roseus]